MKEIVFIIVFCSAAGRVSSQSSAGITGWRDTSYTTSSAYLSALKAYPGITVAQEFHSPAIAEKRNIIYCKTGASGERQLRLDAFYPKKKRKAKRTAILIIHGGGWRSGDRSQHYPLAQRLAGLGYVCFTPEYRLSTEALYPAAIYDIKSAIRWIKRNARKYHIDTTEIAALGFSAGGELAAFAGATNGNSDFGAKGCHLQYSGTVQAVVNIDGILSFVHPDSGEGDDSRKTSAATYWLGYSKKENSEVWKQASPLTHAGKNTPPTLFINSAVDRMHAGREEFIQILSGYNIYTEVKSFENSPHSFCLFDPWFEPTLKYIDEFLKKIFVK